MKKQRQGWLVTGRMDFTFLVLVLILLSIGLLMLFSASYPNAHYYLGNSGHYIIKQLLAAAIGVGGMFALSHFNYRLLKPFSVLAYALSLVLLVYVLFCPPINNAKRWIWVPGLGTFQPSELAKLAIILLFAALIVTNEKTMGTFMGGVLPFGAALLPVLGLLYLEPHMSCMVLIVTLAAVMMFVGGTDIRWFLLAAGVAAAFALYVVTTPERLAYVANRVRFWLDPYSDPQGKGYQTIQSLLTIGSGGLMGAGVGNSRQKFLYLPEAQNDFIFAVVCEELGFVGASLILCLFAVLVWRGFVIALRCRERFGSLVVVGLTTQVGLQTILNIAVVTNTVPNTGISLPFFSYGGTALIILLWQMGIILAVSRQSDLEKE